MMPRILIAPDKFKGSLTSIQVCEAISKGLRSSSDGFDIKMLPLSDGGDGLLAFFRYYLEVKEHRLLVQGPLGTPVNASWLSSMDGRTVYIEMAEASGLHLLSPQQYDCAKASTYGTGQLIMEALQAGAREIIIGLGGSATNDGGTGMAAALGYRFVDKSGNEFIPTGDSLLAIDKIIPPEKPLWKEVSIRCACDVDNLLYGPAGATRIYASQKGADPRMVDKMELGMVHFASLLRGFLDCDVAGMRSAGAAGGTGAGCAAFLGAELSMGMNLVSDVCRLGDEISNAHIVITGEGRLDAQTLHGKLVYLVAGLGKKYGARVIALAGGIDLSATQYRSMGIDVAFSIVNKPMPLEQAQAEAAALLEEIAANLGKLIKL